MSRRVPRHPADLGQSPRAYPCRRDSSGASRPAASRPPGWGSGVTRPSNRGVITAALTAGLALAAVSRQAYLVPALLAVAVVVFAIGWPRLLGLPSPRTSTVVIAASGLSAIGLVAWREDFGILAPVVGFAVLAAFIAEMARRDGRPRLVESVAGTVMGAVVAIAATGWVAVGSSRPALALIVTAATTLAAACAATALPLTSTRVATYATLVATAAGLGLGYLLADVGLLNGGIIGFAAGVLTAAAYLLFIRFPATVRWLPALAAAGVPLLMAGGPTYLVGTLVFL